MADGVSNWRDAALDEETIRLILLLAYEYLEQTGRRISLAELRVSLQAPGK